MLWTFLHVFKIINLRVRNVVVKKIKVGGVTFYWSSWTVREMEVEFNFQFIHFNTILPSPIRGNYHIQSKRMWKSVMMLIAVISSENEWAMINFFSIFNMGIPKMWRYIDVSLFIPFNLTLINSNQSCFLIDIRKSENMRRFCFYQVNLSIVFLHP